MRRECIDPGSGRNEGRKLLIRFEPETKVTRSNGLWGAKFGSASDDAQLHEKAEASVAHEIDVWRRDLLRAVKIKRREQGKETWDGFPSAGWRMAETSTDFSAYPTCRLLRAGMKAI